METYEFDFSYDNGKWDLTNAHIGDGVLHVADTPWIGSGERNPDDNWGHGANDNFELEVDFRRKIVDVEEGIDSWWTIQIEISGDNYIQFMHTTDANNKMSISVNGEEKVFQYQDMNDTNWHTIKIRRMGNIYYLSANGGAELSYNYGIPRAVKEISLSYKHSLPRENNGGEYDNFKYSWWEIEEQDYAFIM